MVQSSRVSKRIFGANRKGINAISTKTALIFILPATILFGTFVIYPLITALSYSLYDWSGVQRTNFIGLQNFSSLFTLKPFNEEIPRAFMHNGLIFTASVIIQNSIGLFLAVLLNRVKIFRRLFQFLFTLPYLVSPLVVGYLWSLLLSPTYGPINSFLRSVGLDNLALPWLGDPDTALWMVILVTSWQWLGFPLLMYGAALGGIPGEIDEAASLDGVNPIQRFFKITLPLISPVIGTVVVLTFVFSMEAFPIPFALGGSSGGPAGSTDVMSLVFYRSASDSNQIGISSAIAILLFLVILVFSLIFNWMFRRLERKLGL